jgi:hypothetical protein
VSENGDVLSGAVAARFVVVVMRVPGTGTSWAMLSEAVGEVPPRVAGYLRD